MGAVQAPPADIQSLQATLASAGRSLALIAAPPATALRDALQGLDIAVFEAADLPGQPVTSLLEDMAVYAGAVLISMDLFWSPDVVPDRDDSPLVMPVWAGIHARDMGDVRRLEYGDGRLTLRGGGGGGAVVQQRIAALMKTAATGDVEAAGLRQRLERLGAAGAEILRAAPPTFERSANVLRIPCGFRSPYLITDPASMEARLDGPTVLVSRRPLTEWRQMAGLLRPLAQTGTPALIVAPELSDEAIALLVVNKLRGIVSAVAVEVREEAWADAITDVTEATPAPQPFDPGARAGRAGSIACDTGRLTILK